MKIFTLFFAFLFLYGCNKPKTVLICGDHICVNKAEAEQYFEDNLTLEVKVLDRNKSKEVSLLEINLESISQGQKKISISEKNQTNKVIKELSNEDIKKKKAELKIRKKIRDNNEKKVASKNAKLGNKKDINKLRNKKIVNKSYKKINDICTLLEKCSIDEISKYLVKQGKKKDFPDITIREN